MYISGNNMIHNRDDSAMHAEQVSFGAGTRWQCCSYHQGCSRHHAEWVAAANRDIVATMQMGLQLPQVM